MFNFYKITGLFKKITLVVLLGLFISGCNLTEKTIAMGGSSSVHALMDSVKNDYTAEVPGASLSYDGPGSSKGIEGIKSGIYQFGFLSREVKDKEKDAAMTVQTIAYDGIAVVVNPQNPVSNLTVDQIRDIYEGKITNWKEVGGNDEGISVVARDAASGTRAAFDEIVEIEAVTTNAILYDSNGAVAQAVESNTSAIGYISFETYVRNSSKLKGLKVNGVDPTSENVKAEEYALYRPFIMVYYPDKLTSNSKEFLNWLDLNLDRIVQDSGYIPVGENNE